MLHCDLALQTAAVACNVRPPILRDSSHARQDFISTGSNPLLCMQVAVNVPLSDKTRGMFNSETIGKMKKGAVLVR